MKIMFMRCLVAHGTALDRPRKGSDEDDPTSNAFFLFWVRANPKKINSACTYRNILKDRDTTTGPPSISLFIAV